MGGTVKDAEGNMIAVQAREEEIMLGDDNSRVEWFKRKGPEPNVGGIEGTADEANEVVKQFCKEMEEVTIVNIEWARRSPYC